MSYHEFMMATMILQAFMMTMTIPIGIIIGLAWNWMPTILRRIICVLAFPFLTWPMLTQWSGMYMGRPPSWFLSVFS